MIVFPFEASIATVFAAIFNTMHFIYELVLARNCPHWSECVYSVRCAWAKFLSSGMSHNASLEAHNDIIWNETVKTQDRQPVSYAYETYLMANFVIADREA